MSEGFERHEFCAQVGQMMDITISNKHSIDPTSTYHDDSDFQIIGAHRRVLRDSHESRARNRRQRPCEGTLHQCVHDNGHAAYLPAVQ